VKQCLLIHQTQPDVFFAADTRHVIYRFTVDPCATEEARTFTLCLADDLAAINAIVDKLVLSALAVTNFTILLNFGEISGHGLLLSGLLGLRWIFFAAHRNLLFVESLFFDALNKLFNELFDFFFAEV
jgi:hypothetical protein